METLNSLGLAAIILPAMDADASSLSSVMANVDDGSVRCCSDAMGSSLLQRGERRGIMPM